MKKKKNEIKDNTSRKNKFVFRVLSLFFSLFLIVILELLLRLFSVGTDYSLFIQNEQESYSDYLFVNPEVGGKYFQKLEYTRPRNDIFLKKKPEDCFRIMVMGSSSVYGFPYGSNLMYSRILHKMLEDAYPKQKIEVVNTAITAINSYTLRDYIDEIIDHEPDAILFYAGHNEFYGAFGIGSNETMSRSNTILRLHLKCMNLRLYQLIQKAVHGIGKSFSKNKPKGTLMKRIVKDKDIKYNSDEYIIAKEYFSDNLRTLLKKAKKNNIPVFLSDVVSNVKDLRPFDAIDGESNALQAFQEAKAAITDSNIAEAKRAFYKARDLDGIRFRASEDFNNIIRSMQNDSEVLPVNMVKSFEQHASNGIVGNDLMTEHVHPNLQGYFIMANTFFEAISKSNLIKSQKTAIPYSQDYYLQNYGYSTLDELTGIHRVELLKNSWPFTNDYNQANQYRNLYSPSSFLDSVAFDIMKFPDITLENEHIKLAEYYKANKDHYNAYKEYESILRINPYLAINYRDAAVELLQLSELPIALLYLTESLKYEESFFAYNKSGQIYLLKGDYEGAIEMFENALKLAPSGKRNNVLSKLYMACTYANNTSKANSIKKDLLAIDPGVNLNLPQKRNYYMDYVPHMINKEVTQARKHIRQGEYASATELLKLSLQTWRSPIALRLLGDINIQTKQFKTAQMYYNEVYTHFMFEPRFVHNNLLLYLTLKDRKSAQGEFKHLQEIAPEHPALKHLTPMLNAN